MMLTLMPSRAISTTWWKVFSLIASFTMASIFDSINSSTSGLMMVSFSSVSDL